MCFDTFHPDKSQKKQLLQSYSSLMSAPASSFTQREDNVNQVWPYRIRSIRTTQHIFETTVIKPIPFILFHPDNFAQEKAAYHQTFSPLHLAAASNPNPQLRQLPLWSVASREAPDFNSSATTSLWPSSAAISSDVRPRRTGGCRRNLANGEFWKAESLFLPYNIYIFIFNVQKIFKTVLTCFNIIPFARWLNHCLSRQLLQCQALLSRHHTSNTHFCVRAPSS